MADLDAEVRVEDNVDNKASVEPVQVFGDLSNLKGQRQRKISNSNSNLSPLKPFPLGTASTGNSAADLSDLKGQLDVLAARRLSTPTASAKRTPEPSPFAVPDRIRTSFDQSAGGRRRLHSHPITLNETADLPSPFHSSPTDSIASSAATPLSSRISFSSSRRPSVFIVRTPGDNKFSARFVRLQTFSSLFSLSVNDPSWIDLLSADRFPQASTSQEAFDMDMATLNTGEEMVRNNRGTHNFNTLLLYLISQLRFMRHTAYGGLFTKYFVDNLSRIQIHEQFEMDRIHPRPSPILDSNASSSSKPSFELDIDPRVRSDKRLRAEQLLEELFQIIIYADTSTATGYEFYLETLNVLIVFFSTQLQQSTVETAEGNYFLDIVNDRLGHFARGTVGRCLEKFIEQQPMPVNAGVLYSAYSYLFPGKNTSTSRVSRVADKSVLLLLVLANQLPINVPNEFRSVLSQIKDANISAKEMEAQAADLDSMDDLRVPFRSIYQTVCSNLAVEENSLLLYLLMLQNFGFRTYVLSRTDPESLLLPVLKLIYECVETKTNYSQLYILLIIILLVSQDDVYNENIQRITIPSQPWYTERIIKTVSLGGLTILILIRTIQANLAHHKDVYFHTNCLASLANMSSKIVGIHPIVSQRLISKRYLKLQSRTSHSSLPEAETDADLVVYGDLVALILEIINSVMTHTLKHNPQLVYALLHRRDMFVQFRLHPRFGDLIENIDTVIAYFHSKLLELDSKIPSSTTEVLKVIEQHSKTWPSTGRLKVFADLKFMYEEEKEFSLFFLPYVWSLGE
ncbi:hypothetical protein HK102_013049 [Quaeritorhiza haematococci]|nr:hypothetical protein HK102_013049 [Quaeritorhiza haematococci]